MRIVLCDRWGRAQVCGDEVDIVGGVVDGHGARTSLGLDRFDRRKGCWRVFVGDGQSTVAARGEGIAGGGIEAIGVDTLADGNGAEDFTRVPVDESHELVVATDN